jgi:hypothetical protein
MKTKLDKKLVLSREEVRELSDSELDRAAGGASLLVTSCQGTVRSCSSISWPGCICPPPTDWTC